MTNTTVDKKVENILYVDGREVNSPMKKICLK